MAIASEAPTVTKPAPPGLRLPVLVQTLLFGQFRPQMLQLLRRRHGDVFSVRIAPAGRLVVVLARPEDIKTVFTGPATVFHAGEGNAILKPVMGEHSVLLVDEDEHRRVRRLLMPAFHGAALRGYQDLVARLAKAEVDRWPSGRDFRSHDRMNALTLEVILQVVFGVTDPGRLATLRPLVRGIVAIGPTIMLGWFYPKLQRIGPWKRYTAFQRDLDRLLYAEIAERRTANDLADRDDVLSRLLRTGAESPGDQLTDAELRDQLITLLLAGHETTATTLAWILHELARRPDELRRAQRAADEQDDDYLAAVAKEALRKRPVIYEVARRLTEPIEIGGYRIPAGAVVAPGIGLVQADPLNYPEPDEFRPSRFVDGQPAANTWIPFGGGVRRCLGAGFSLMEASVVLAEVLRRYDVRPDRARPEKQRARNITLIPARGARIAVTPRSARTSTDR
ncbi:MAG TPA: cytochrome P450 [Pseudonocardiaceae bacterium]|nr:cytochrome P450 [Pseudonocardiaceae bacterium]